MISLNASMRSSWLSPSCSNDSDSREITRWMTSSFSGSQPLPWPSISSACWKLSPSLWAEKSGRRSEEHTSELQSRLHLVCRLLLEKKKNNQQNQHTDQI